MAPFAVPPVVYVSHGVLGALQIVSKGNTSNMKYLTFGTVDFTAVDLRIF